MTKEELYLKTMFCCMACDGDIADEEVELIKEKASEKTGILKGINIEECINGYINEINKNGVAFLNQYLKELGLEKLTTEEQMNIVNISIDMIEADHIIQYTEIKFFKKIRKRLTLSDEEILKVHPDKEDFLLPDITVLEDPVWENVTFNKIEFNFNQQKSDEN